MAFLTRKEFAALCHTTVLIVNSNKARGKIIVNDDGLINTNNALNKNFFERYNNRFNEEKKNPESIVQKKEADLEKKTSKKRVKKSSAKNKKSSRVNNSNSDIDDASQKTVEWMERKKKADALLVEYRAEHEKLKMDKLAGKLIPVDLVFRILNIHNKSIFSAFQSDSENLASVYCEILAEGDRKKLAEIMHKISEIINNLVDKSKDLAEMELDNAIAEYSETLNRGQRK